MRFSRPCYDKFHRCPGWNGGGMKFARTQHCEGGYLGKHYEKRFWAFRVARCPKCGVYVLPYHIRKLDWTWHRYHWPSMWNRTRDEYTWRWHNLTCAEFARELGRDFSMWKPGFYWNWHDQLFPPAREKS